MELRYCEECGDVIRLESDEPAKLHEHFICPKCKGEAPAGQSRVEAPRSQTGQFSAADLDLFSSQSIALRKQEFESELQKAPETRLRLVQTTETSVAEAEQPVQAPATASPSPRLPRSPAAATATAPREAAATAAAGATTGGRPAKSARKIIFRCLHCKSPLSIRPVEKTSKLVCPACGQAVYVTPTGRLLKKNPSLAVRKDPSAAPQGAATSSLAHPGAGLRASAVAPQPAVRAAPHMSHSHFDDAAETLERLSAFEEHVFSQDPNKTAFLTEESSPLSDLRGSESEEFPLANEFLSTAVRPRPSAPELPQEEWSEDEEDWPEEEWPGESDLLAEDEFDENRDSGSRRRATRRPPAVRVMLVGAGLLLPFALAVALFVTHFSDPDRRAFDPDPALTTLEKLGNAAKRGITALLSDGEDSRAIWGPGH